MRRRWAPCVPGAALVLCALLVGKISFAAPGPREVIDETANQVLVVLRDKSLEKQQKIHRIEDIAYARFDFDTISRLVLARNWNSLSDSQQREFVKEFKEHLSVTYGRNVDSYSNEKVVIVSDREEARGDWTVKTKIIRSTGDDFQVDYRLRQKDADWKIIDVVIEGVSLIANFRSQFQDIISSGGIDHLITLLREKNAAGETIVENPKLKPKD